MLITEGAFKVSVIWYLMVLTLTRLGREGDRWGGGGFCQNIVAILGWNMISSFLKSKTKEPTKLLFSSCIKPWSNGA